MTTSVSITNMNLFDTNSKIRHYTSPEAIIEDFFGLRIDYYHKRKDHLAVKLGSELNRLDNKVRFILMVVNGELVVSNRKKVELIGELEKLGFSRMNKSEKGPKTALNKDEDDAAEDDDAEDSKPSDGKGKTSGAGYDYLLGMPLWSLTKEKVDELCKDKTDKEAELDWLLSKSPEDLWMIDLDEFSAALDEFEADEAAAVAVATRINKSANGKKKPLGAAKPKKKKSFDSDDDDDDISDFSDDDDDDFDGGKKKKAPPKKAPTQRAKLAPNTAAAAAPKSLAPKSAPWLEPKPVVQDDDSLSLMERLKLKSLGASTASAAIKPPVALKPDRNMEEVSSGDDDSEVKPKAKPRAKAVPKKKPIESDEEEDDDFAEKPKPKAKAKAKAAPKCSDSDEDAFEFDAKPKKAAAKPKAATKKRAECSPVQPSSSLVDSPPVVKAAPKKLKTAAAQKKAAPKKKVVSDDEEDDFEPEVTSTPLAKPERSQRARAAVTYKVDAGSDSDEDSDDASEISEFSDE